MNLFKPSFLLLGTVLCLFISCSSTDDSNENGGVDSSRLLQLQQTFENIGNTEWTFTNYQNEPLSEEYTNRMLLGFREVEGNSVVFYAGGIVNGFQGGFEINEEESRLSINTQTLGTLAASENPTDNMVEAQYIKSLETSVFFEIIDGELLLYQGAPDDEGVEIMNFVPSN